jgi:hypothetical protein
MLGDRQPLRWPFESDFLSRQPGRIPAGVAIKGDKVISLTGSSNYHGREGEERRAETRLLIGLMRRWTGSGEAEAV